MIPTLVQAPTDTNFLNFTLQDLKLIATPFEIQFILNGSLPVAQLAIHSDNPCPQGVIFLFNPFIPPVNMLNLA
ncbi:hypothetical protein SAMN02745123_01248 [Desulforamulus aeronauticus DSM 10349]|uniref:Uncharacterized protein n=1 Tax=Desulforamulus aeronauticus DSM 10349 TaxID=1121421 RepID=A0A1M6QWP0_9FIRM|nr:hypothetical protein SAMN02745123_01248 [Desulforamulus aeronauticus DSM 10349]